MFKNLGTISIVLVVLALVAAVIFWPFAVIFALNTLFPLLAIQSNFWTWLAVVILNTTYFIRPTYKKD